MEPNGAVLKFPISFPSPPAPMVGSTRLPRRGVAAPPGEPDHGETTLDLYDTSGLYHRTRLHGFHPTLTAGACPPRSGVGREPAGTQLQRARGG